MHVRHEIPQQVLALEMNVRQNCQCAYIVRALHNMGVDTNLRLVLEVDYNKVGLPLARANNSVHRKSSTCRSYRGLQQQTSLLESKVHLHLISRAICQQVTQLKWCSNLPSHTDQACSTHESADCTDNSRTQALALAPKALPVSTPLFKHAIMTSSSIRSTAKSAVVIGGSELHVVQLIMTFCVLDALTAIRREFLQ